MRCDDRYRARMGRRVSTECVVQHLLGAVERHSHRALWMLEAITDRQYCEKQQRYDLDGVDREVGQRRRLNSAVRDIGDRKRGDNCDHSHEYWTGSSGIHAVREKDPDDVADHDAYRRRHRTWVDPVVQMRAPTEHEFCHSCEPEVLRVVEERLLGEQG